MFEAEENTTVTSVPVEGDDLIELGSVSQDTKGSPFGIRADGGGGLTYF
jgi:hypothetical protein